MNAETDHEAHDKLAMERILHDIKEFGCHLNMFEADGYNPSFVYSVGIYETFGQPEFIMFGLKPQLMAVIINDLVDKIKVGNQYLSGQSYSDSLDGYDVHFLEVDRRNYKDYLGYAGWYYKYNWDFAVLQLIWPDKASFWPWESNFNHDWKHLQPLLDRNADFKFPDPPELAVATTAQVLQGNPITYVSHDEDGGWQFHSETSSSMVDMRFVSLKHITELDNTINELFQLNYGEYATRTKYGDKWVIGKLAKFEEQEKPRTEDRFVGIPSKIESRLNEAEAQAQNSNSANSERKPKSNLQKIKKWWS